MRIRVIGMMQSKLSSWFVLGVLFGRSGAEPSNSNRKSRSKQLPNRMKVLSFRDVFRYRVADGYSKLHDGAFWTDSASAVK